MIRAPGGDPSHRPTRLVGPSGAAGAPGHRAEPDDPARRALCRGRVLPSVSGSAETSGERQRTSGGVPCLSPWRPCRRPAATSRPVVGSAAGRRPGTIRRVADGWSPEPRALIGPAIPSGIGPPGAGMMGARSLVLPRLWRGS